MAGCRRPLSRGESECKCGPDLSNLRATPTLLSLLNASCKEVSIVGGFSHNVQVTAQLDLRGRGYRYLSLTLTNGLPA